MKKLIVVSALLILAGCGQSEAEEDYTLCNEEFAAGFECTEEEFKEYLLLDYENHAELFGGAEEATAETQTKVLNEIDEKIEEIFEWMYR